MGQNVENTTYHSRPNYAKQRRNYKQTTIISKKDFLVIIMTRVLLSEELMVADETCFDDRIRGKARPKRCFGYSPFIPHE